MSWRVVVVNKRAKLDLQMNYLVIRSEEITKIYLGEISTVIAYFGVSGHLNRNYSDSIPETSGHPAVSSILRQQRVIFKALHDFFCCDFPH